MSIRETLRSLIEESVDTEGQKNILTDYDLNRIIAEFRNALWSDRAIDAVARLDASQQRMTHLYESDQHHRAFFQRRAKAFITTALEATE